MSNDVANRGEGTMAGEPAAHAGEPGKTTRSGALAAGNRPSVQRSRSGDDYAFYPDPANAAGEPVGRAAGPDPFGLHLAPSATVQCAGDPDGDTAQVHEAAQRGISGGSAPLPHLGAIQSSFGRHDVSGVEAHTDGTAAAAATAMGATAYATGNAVAFVGAPDLHTAAHEAAHVVQQRAGVSFKGGVGQAGDRYEQHADAVADKVVRGESAETLLGQMGGGGPTGAVQRASAPPQTAPSTATSAVPPALLALAGVSVSDGGGYTFVVEADASFKIIAAPPDRASALGKLIRPGDAKLAAAWQSLAAKVQKEHPAPAPAAAPAPGAAPVVPAAPAAGSAMDTLLGGLSAIGDAIMSAPRAIGDLVSALGEGLGGLLGGKATPEVPPETAAAPGAGQVAGPAAAPAGGSASAAPEPAPTPSAGGPTVSTPGAASGPVSPANHQSRGSFKQPQVPENATTTAIIDSVWPHYALGDQAIGGYLSSGQQYWKVNYHWELVVWVCNTASGLVDAEHKPSFDTIATTLRAHAPTPASGYLDDSAMSIVDSSTQEEFDARFATVKQAKADLTAAIAASGAQGKVTGWKADRFTLSVQNVLPPGESNKHGKGFALDIKGSNARIAETSKSLGASTTYDEKYHVHVEFASGVSVPAAKTTPPAPAPTDK